jgi:hypothetical protein
MSWTSTQVTQNGNSTVGWDISGSSLSNADAIVVRLVSGGSGLRINSVTARVGPNRYHVNVSVIGSGAVAFKFSAEEMD